MYTEHRFGKRGQPNLAQRLRSFLRVPAVRRSSAAKRPARRPMVIEAMEPRYLLSAEGMLPPPNPQEQHEWVLNAPITTSPEAVLAQFSGVQTFNATAQQINQVNELIFVDPGVQGHEALVAEALAFYSELDPQQSTRAEVVVLDPLSDGVEQIARWLVQYEDLRAIHIISHGDSGAVRLGNVLLDADNLEQHAASLNAWGRALLAGADILIYGCNVALGERGEQFIASLAAMTGADVAASDNSTGDSQRGGDWTLEQRTGSIEATALFAFGPMWSGLLDSFISSTADQHFAGSSGDDSFVFGNDWGNDTATAGGGHDLLDFSAVTSALKFTINGGQVVVEYADPARAAHRFEYTAAAGQLFSLKGGQGDDLFVIVDDGFLVNIDAGLGNDQVSFANAAAPVGLVRSGAVTTASGSRNYTLEGAEAFTGHISLGSTIRNEIDQAIGKWSEVAGAFVASELLATQVPLLNLSLAEIIGQGFADGTVPDSLAAARSYVADLLTVNAASLNELTNLGALAQGIEAQLNAAANGNPFTVTAGLYDWNELRLELFFDASRSFDLTPMLSTELTAALGSAGLALSAFSDLSVNARLGGSVALGVRMDGFSTLDPGSVANQGFLRVDPLTVSVDANVTGLTASAGLSAQVFGSAATVNIVDGVASLQARATLALDPNAADGEGRFALHALTATPVLKLEASGSLDARLPLSTTLGSFNLSNLGTPTLILATDSLFEYRNGALLVTTPAVSLDVALNAALVEKLMDLLGQVRDLGQQLPFDLFDRDLPGLGQSLNQLLTNSESAVEAGGLGSTFQLKDAAGRYFYTDYNANTGVGTTLNLGAK